jgi:hypothetical protein
MATSTDKTKTSTPRSRKTPARKPAAKSAAKATSGTKKLALGTLSVGAIVGAVAAAAFAALKLGQRARGSAEHVPTDLLGDTHPGPDDRAPVDFRPDPTAPIPSGERDAFRPALAGAAAPTLVKGQARENERLDAAPS